jgi:3-hydroxyacyl-CoA dehydrogenase/enoyl-CoA hydratase/3-hydroxybutyryl-CoA epimerase
VNFCQSVNQPGFELQSVFAFNLQLNVLFDQGVSVGRLDAVLRARGFPVGPCTLTDEVGLDVGLHIAK